MSQSGSLTPQWGCGRRGMDSMFHGMTTSHHSTLSETKAAPSKHRAVIPFCSCEFVVGRVTSLCGHGVISRVW